MFIAVGLEQFPQMLIFLFFAIDLMKRYGNIPVSHAKNFNFDSILYNPSEIGIIYTRELEYTDKSKFDLITSFILCFLCAVFILSRVLQGVCLLISLFYGCARC